jgi:hypothetical protein
MTREDNSNSLLKERICFIFLILLFIKLFKMKGPHTLLAFSSFHVWGNKGGLMEEGVKRLLWSRNFVNS